MIIQNTYDGITPATRQELVQFFEQQLKQIYGDATQITPDTVAGQICGIHVGMFEHYASLLLQLMKNLDINTATGTPLEYITAHFGIKRKQGGASSSSNARVLGINGTFIKAGSEFVDTSNNIWTTLSEVTISDSSTVSLICSELGEIPLERNSILQSKIYINGLQNITTTEDAKLGAEMETDQELRERYNLQLYQQGRNLRQSLYSKLISLEGVTHCKILENNSDTIQEGIPARSVKIIINGGDNSKIAETIANNTAMGINLIGSELYNYTPEDLPQLSVDIRFERPSIIIEPLIKFKIKPATRASFLDIDKITSNILNIPLNIGDGLKLSTIAKAIMLNSPDVEGWSIINNIITISTDNGTTYNATDLNASTSTLIKIKANNIQIEKVDP